MQQGSSAGIRLLSPLRLTNEGGVSGMPKTDFKRMAATPILRGETDATEIRNQNSWGPSPALPFLNFKIQATQRFLC